MVDQESRSYRPRRAFIEPEPEPTPAPVAEPAPAAVPVSRPTAPKAPKPPKAPNFDDEDAPKPLYRDEYLPQTLYRDEPAVNGRATPPAVNGTAAEATAVNGTPSAYAVPPRPDADDVGSDDTAIRSFTFAPRTRRNDETTTILARSGSTARGRHGPSGPSGPDEIDDFEDAEDGRPIGERARWALAIGVIAAVVVLGLAIGYAVLGLGDDPVTNPTPPSESAGSVGPAPTTSGADPAPTTGALLTTDMMLTAAQAKPIDGKRTWKEVLTQRGASEDAPVPACFGGEPDPAQPVSQQKVIRVLSSGDKGAPNALHDATAYATPEEAAQAFSVASRTLGTCPAAGAWIASGRSVRGLGDRSAAAVIAVVDGESAVSHSVVISQTGRVLNILDASRASEGIAPASVASALVSVLEKQCKPAGGKCGGDAQVRSGPPPLGGDQPGFLAAGDLAPVADSVAPWNAAPVELPQEDFVGASCENVNWATVPGAEKRESRVYLHPDSGTAYFGVNQIVLQFKDNKAANSLVERVRTNLEDCKLLTATVSDPDKVTGVGARDAEVTGYTAVVEQKGTDGSDKFRVGIVRAGNKVAYTFANPKGDFDFTDKQWDTIAVRAGERVTQVNS